MAGLISAANLGGVADARLGDETDAIGTTFEHRGSVSQSFQPPDTHGHNSIYLDSSITFEDYNYWANRSREYERHIRTDNVGLRQVANLIIGRKIKNESPITTEKDLSEKRSEDEKNGIADFGGGDNNYGVTESEWEQAQRATRTATWGKLIPNIGRSTFL